MNSLGQKIETIYQGELQNGLNQFNYSTGTLPKGVYFIRVSGDKGVQTTKLIKE